MSLYIQQKGKEGRGIAIAVFIEHLPYTNIILGVYMLSHLINTAILKGFSSQYYKETKAYKIKKLMKLSK